MTKAAQDMTKPFESPVLRFLHRMSSDTAAPDGELLSRFIQQRNEDAFTVLVRRHGPTVVGVCRRWLRDEADVEDAFQATFLVLARKADSIAKPDAVGSWLFGVAYRTARKARGDVARRQGRQEPLPDLPADEDDDPAWRDLRPLLDEEINRLPEKYRQPFVLCYLEGLTNTEAARALSLPKGTVLTRLAWARRRLRDRLVQRGVTLGAVAFAGLWTQSADAASVPEAWIASVSKSAVQITGSRAALASTVPARVAGLTEAGMAAVGRSHMSRALLVLVLAVIGVGAAWQTYLLFGAPLPIEQAQASAVEWPVSDDAAIQGEWVMESISEKTPLWSWAMGRPPANVGESVNNERKQSKGLHGVPTTLDVSANRFVVKVSDGRMISGAYEFDTAKSPKWVNLVTLPLNDREPILIVKGIYELQGDVLKLAYPQKGYSARPTDFEESDEKVVVIYKKKR